MASTQSSSSKRPASSKVETEEQSSSSPKTSPKSASSSSSSSSSKTTPAKTSSSTSAKSDAATLKTSTKQPPKALVPTSSTGPRLYLTIALAVSAVLWFIPFSDWLLYPLRLMVTFFHEAGHALATLLTFGSVKSLVVSPDTSGMVTRTGGIGFIISSAGYLGTTALGASLILLSRNVGLIPKTFLTLGVVSIASTVFWAGSYPTWPVAIALGLVFAPLYLMERKAEEGDKLARLVPDWLRAKRQQLQIAAGVLSAGALIYLGMTGALLTMIVGIGGGAALIFLGKRAPLPVAQFALAFLAVQTSFNALEDLRTLFGLSVHSPHTHTDAANMAKELFLPAAFWASIWAILALGILTAALWRFYELPSIAMLRAKFSKTPALASGSTSPKAALPNSTSSKPKK